MFKTVNINREYRISHLGFYFSLTIKAKDDDQFKQTESNTTLNNQNLLSALTPNSSDIFSLLVNAQEKFQESVCFQIFFFIYFIKY
jgi:hypothetical protein